MKIPLLQTLLILSLLFFTKFSYAHPGNTAADGCHYCWTNCERWGYVYGTRHCHGGGVAIPRYTAPVVDYTFPSMNASWKWTPNSDSQTFNIEIDLKDPSTSNYSVTLNKCAGCNPGPLIDYYTNKFYFSNINPGTWYLNIKKGINGYWSTTAYWTVNIPEWYEPIPTSQPSTSPLQGQGGEGVPIITYLALGTAGYLGYKLINKIK